MVRTTSQQKAMMGYVLIGLGAFTIGIIVGQATKKCP